MILGGWVTFRIATVSGKGKSQGLDRNLGDGYEFRDLHAVIFRDVGVINWEPS